MTNPASSCDRREGFQRDSHFAETAWLECPGPNSGESACWPIPGDSPKSMQHPNHQSSNIYLSATLCLEVFCKIVQREQDSNKQTSATPVMRPALFKWTRAVALRHACRKGSRCVGTHVRRSEGRKEASRPNVLPILERTGCLHVFLCHQSTYLSYTKALTD